MAGPVPAIHAFIFFRTRGCAGQARACRVLYHLFM